jgi:hypothetical protein
VKRPVTVLAVLVALSLPGLSQGQTFQNAINTLKSRLNDIETRLTAIERTSTVESPTNGAEIDQAVDAHAQAASRAFAVVMTELRDGASEGLEHAKELESTLKDHRSRAAKATEKIAEIDANIRIGKIRLARPVLESLTPRERREFRRTLKPEVDSDYKREHPALFPGHVSYISDHDWRALKQDTCEPCGELAISDPEDESSLLQQILGELPRPVYAEASVAPGHASAVAPTVHAALGYVCYTICAATIGAACLQCVVGAGAAAVAAYDSFVRCRHRCHCRCRWYKPWCCACKSVCWTAFLSALA